MDKLETEMNKAKEGVFLIEYGLKNFIKVSEALSIGRVKWTIVKKAENQGEKGFIHLDYYMPEMEFLILCGEIENKLFHKKIEADKANQYPSAYKYTTGKDGCLHLTIGVGKSTEVVVSIQNATTKERMLMGTSLKAFEEMSKRYSVFTGYRPISPNSYMSQLQATFNEGRAERERMRREG